MRLGILIREMRAEFLTASALPVLQGTVLVRYETGSWDQLLFWLTLAGAVFMHLGANIANDYYDHLSGSDPANTDFVRPFTGGSRLIQEGMISPPAVLALSIIFFAAAAAIGIVLWTIAGRVVIMLGAAGLFLGFFYTAPPVRLAARGLGELAVAAGFGLITIGTYYVQTGTVSLQAAVLSLPLALLTAAIIVINEFQDSKADGMTGKRTLVVRLGRRRSVILYAVVAFGAYVPLLAGAAAGLFPRTVLLALLSSPFAMKAAATARVKHGDPARLAPANASTIACHLLTGMLICAAYLLAG